MLRIVSGAAHSARDKEYCQLVRKAAEDGREVLVIVPDQYSFESDKKLYNVLGAKAFNRISSAGFNRLAELIAKKYGSRSRENAADNSKIIVMFKAVNRFESEKKALFFKKSLKKIKFIGEMIRLVEDLLRAGITPEDMRIASEKLEGSISGKLYDVSVISRYYLDGLAEAGLKDSVSSLGESLAIARDRGYFNSMSVFVDGFTSFSYDEYRMLECILKQADELTVSLMLAHCQGDPDTPFNVSLRTEQRLVSMAKEQNKPLKQIVCEPEGEGKSVSELIDRRFCGLPAMPESCNGLTVASGNDVYDELEYVCSEIERLVREEHYSYNDIALACREPEVVSSATEGIFERYGIPYFIDRAVKADSSVIVIYLKSIFECIITKNYRTDAIMRYIKSPLCPILDYDIAALEDYCITYNVEGDMWLSPFCTHDKKNRVSSRLEELRKTVIEPLERFKLAGENASASEICKALFELLTEIDVSKQVYSVVKRASASQNETQLELARANKQLWMNVLGAFKSINDELADEKISLRKTYELFKLMTAAMTISAPPQKLDSVRCINAESSRLDNVKALFVIEVNDGVFPAAPRSEGLFTEREKQLLSEIDLTLENTAKNSVDNEKLTVYQTLCLPSDKLYILYSETDGKGRLKNPSSIVTELKGQFGEDIGIRISDLPLSFFCTDLRSAYYKYLERSKDKLAVIRAPGIVNEEKKQLILDSKARADEAATLEAALMNNEIYSAKLAALPKYGEEKQLSVSKATAKKLFFEDKLMLSATKVNEFYRCPFAFFCKHGLKLRMPHKIELNPMYRGNYLHRTIEDLLSTVEGEGKGFNKSFVFYTEEQLREKIHASFLRYEAEEIGGSYGKTPAYYAELEQYENSVYENVKLIQKEFSDSGFLPELFEYRLDKGDGTSILELKFTDDLTICIQGSIDRVDTFTDESGKKYIRIVDYKTGSTELHLDSLYHGLNLQMLIYLLAITNDGSAEPAGVQYSHIKEADCDRLPDDSEDEEVVLPKRLKAYKPDGLFVGEDKLMQALNRSYGGAFTPFTFNKDMSLSKSSKQPVSEKFLIAAEEFARRKIISLAEKLLKGSVPAEPVVTGKYTPCSNCDHYAVCGKVLRGDPEEVKPEDKDRFLEEIEKISNELNGGESNA
ncbi:MAG: PD-(D/E)XK nuclease family protein [Ruminococcus sp.]|nr:PD-(D/E)XK nuclease family protein [Ruminococcus sp.]